jgi:hypothetical protein
MSTIAQIIHQFLKENDSTFVDTVPPGEKPDLKQMQAALNELQKREGNIFDDPVTYRRIMEAKQDRVVGPFGLNTDEEECEVIDLTGSVEEAVKQSKQIDKKKEKQQQSLNKWLGKKKKSNDPLVQDLRKVGVTYLAEKLEESDLGPQLFRTFAFSVDPGPANMGHMYCFIKEEPKRFVVYIDKERWGASHLYDWQEEKGVSIVRFVRSWLWRMFPNNIMMKGNLVFMEEQYMPGVAPNMGGIKRLNASHKLIELMLVLYSIFRERYEAEVIMMRSSDVKKGLKINTGDHDDNKKSVIQWCKDQGLKPENDHAADCVALLHRYLTKKKNPLNPTCKPVVYVVEERDAFDKHSLNEQ